jgi:hypothetical protein
MKNNIKYKFASFVINIISKTWRTEIFGNYPQKPAIIVFWHTKMLPGWRLFRNNNSIAVVSTSKDGELLVSLLKRWGFSFIRGSSSKGGKEVLENIVEFAKSNYVLITPDGPRGPEKVMKAGAVVAASRAEVDLIYLNIDIEYKIIFSKSWDKFQFPLPFTKIKIKISEPINLKRNFSREQIDDIINLIQKEMN